VIAAIYARKSTEQAGVSDEEKSVTRQVEHARAYAARKGLTVLDEHIYVDDGISGAEFVKRPAFLRMMNALRPRPPFQVLIISEESRLGREQIETAWAFKQIIDAGVRIFCYLDDKEPTLDTALGKFLLSATNFAAEVEREKASQRTYDAMRRKAEAGHVTGGRVYGYDNVEAFADSPGPDGKHKRLYVTRKINPEQAAVVRRIFALCAAGDGFTRIAKALNAEHIPPPRSGSKGWAPTAIREIVYRPLYRGEITWNQTQKIHRRGTKAQRRRTEAEVLRIPAPDLRIVPDDLWQAAHDRLARTRNAYRLDGPSGAEPRPSRLDGDSPYLLSGMLRCTACGGAIISLSRHHGRRRGFFYGCAYNSKRGPEVCPNNVHLPQAILEQAVLDAMAEALDEHLVAAAIERAVGRLREGQETEVDRRASIEREISVIEAKQQRLVEAIKHGEALEPLVAALKVEQERQAALRAELEGFAQFANVSSLDRKRLERDLTALAADARELLGGHTREARRLLQKMLIDRLECEPFREGGVTGYRFAGEATYGGLLAGEAWPTNSGGPNGIRTRAASLLRGALEQHPDTEFERGRGCCHRNKAPPCNQPRGYRGESSQGGNRCPIEAKTDALADITPRTKARVLELLLCPSNAASALVGPLS
jgi:site-specific DNA recombinase